jgi:hypothetical protein
MLKQIFKQSVSFITFLVICIIFLIVHFTGDTKGFTVMGSLLYLGVSFAGLELIRRTLLFYFSELAVSVTLLIIAFGTNLFNLVALDYNLQPLVLFSLSTLILFSVAQWHMNPKTPYAVLMGLAIGCFSLFMATGIIAFLVPVLWGVYNKTSWEEKISLVKRNKEQFWHFIGYFLILFLTPVILGVISPGEIKLFSFTLPGIFYSFSSWLWEDLFSFAHGWLIYSPIMLLALIGFYYFARSYRQFFYSVFLFVFLGLFMESSWSKLGSTEVFGQIAFIPYYGFLALPFAALIARILKGGRTLVTLFTLILVLLMGLNVFQTWQFNEGIILKSGMTSDAYALAFGRTYLTGVEQQIEKRLEPDLTSEFQNESKSRKSLLAFYDFEDINVPYKSKLENAIVKSGNLALMMDSTTQFSPVFKMSFKDFTDKPRVGLRITVSVFSYTTKGLADLNLVFSAMHERMNYRYARLKLSDLNLKTGVWNTVSFDYQIPISHAPDDVIVSYVWYPGSSPVYIDDLKYEAFELKDKYLYESIFKR